MRYNVGDVIRMPHYYYSTNRKRVWRVTGEHLGAIEQEGTYSLVPLDILENEPIHVPCIILETHPDVEKV